MPAGAVIWPKLDIMCFCFSFFGTQGLVGGAPGRPSPIQPWLIPSVLRSLAAVCNRAKKRFVHSVGARTAPTRAVYTRAELVQAVATIGLPAVLKTVGFHRSDITMSDETIQHLIQRFSQKEEGVRGLKRALTKLTQRLNVLRLTNGRLREGTQSRDTHPELPYTLHGQPLKFPLTLTRELVDKVLPASEDEQSAHGAPPPSMYC